MTTGMLPRPGTGTPIYHVITPGDHYSPRTGSALPTVVHGLASAGSRVEPGRYAHYVVVQSGTYTPRYDSAVALEYPGSATRAPRARKVDAALARLGRPRRATAEQYAGAMSALENRPAGFVFAHNAPIVPYLLRDKAHIPILYAHNEVLRSYGRAELAKVLGDRTQLVCVSDALAAVLRARLPRSLHERVHTVVNGVDDAQFTPATGKPRTLFRVGFVGRLLPAKGAAVLLEAATRISRPDVEYIIIGSRGFDRADRISPYERRLRDLAGQVSASVRFEPFTDRILLPSLLRELDLLVVPARWFEPCGLTVGEGMATGLAVVAARVGGIPEVLGETGVYIDPRDPDDVARAILRLADDEPLRRRLGQQARTRAEEHNWEWAWRRLSTILQATQ